MTFQSSIHRVFCYLCILIFTLSINGCANIQLKKQVPSTTHLTPGAPSETSNQGTLSGTWKIGFQADDKTLQSTAQLTQNGETFSGTGTDDQSGLAFTIEQGHIQDNQVTFFKKYQSGAQVEYTGTFETVSDPSYSGPYLSGEYTLANKGQIVTNKWEAEKDLSSNPAPSESTAAPDTIPAETDTSSPPHSLWPTDKAPDLSGKWEVAYEYNFKHVHSVMYLEQEEGSITGHGTDINTQESFTIPKGWYGFPKITIVKKYARTNGKHGRSERTVVFKGDVSIVNAADYQGPYMHGETQGGGAWEAQLVK